jgi:hypothetical protein
MHSLPLLTQVCKPVMEFLLFLPLKQSEQSAPAFCAINTPANVIKPDKPKRIFFIFEIVLSETNVRTQTDAQIKKKNEGAKFYLLKIQKNYVHFLTRRLNFGKLLLLKQ